MRFLLLILTLCIGLGSAARAQDLTIATVTRPPFSMLADGKDTGFSIELWEALAKDIGKSYQIRRLDSFGEMLKLVEDGQVDAAVANISITATREQIMDFSQPIFESGLQIMTRSNGQSSLSMVRKIMSKQMILAILAAFALLFACGMVMWRLERRSQPYFDLPARQAMFPAFWWALNLLVNGGFEERVPRTALGRIFGIFLVISSLFLVSIFVARITAVLTVDAIQNNVNSVNDLYGKQVATIDGSTAAAYLDGRDLNYAGYPDLESLLAAFEDGSVDAVVFDAPILSYYVKRSNGDAMLAGPVFLRENYGIALPSGSALAEDLNQSLLKLRENSVYDRIYRKWFGNTNL